MKERVRLSDIAMVCILLIIFLSCAQAQDAAQEIWVLFFSSCQVTKDHTLLCQFNA